MSSEDDSPGNFYNELYVVDSDDEDKDNDDEVMDLLNDSMIGGEDADLYEMEPGPSGYKRKDVEDISDEDDWRTPSPPAYSPLSSPEHGQRSPSLSRSRSPLKRNPDSQPQSLSETVVIGIFDENGVPLEGGMDEDPQEYSAPNAHSLFVPAPAVASSPSVRRARTRIRETARNGRPPPPITSGTTKWKVGMPLQEVFKTDQDVLPEILALADKERRRVRVPEVPDSDEGQFLDASGEPAQPEVFEWKPMDSFRGTAEKFTVKRTGAVNRHTTAYDAFRAFWPDDFLQEIVDQTNKYASRIPSSSFQSQWYDINLHEILGLFAFWMMLGIIRMPTVKSCFSTINVMKTSVFKTIFGPRRHINLTRAIHFADERDEAVKNDRLGSIRPIIDKLNASFKANYVPSQNVSLDESLTLWKGRLNIKQYIPLKSAKFGIKTFEVCDSTTGYLWSFIVYTGKQKSLEYVKGPSIFKSSAIVKVLIRPLLNKGYRLFMDNWYNSPSLARWLKRNHTDCVGTLRASRSEVPKIVQSAPLAKGQLVARHSGDVCVLAWQDKKRVTMISTCHGSATAIATVQSRPDPNWPLAHKPQVVLDYNKFMGGVDLKDQMLEPYLIERKRCGWYMKLFKRLLNVSILNARILLESNAERQNHLDFRVSLVSSILVKHMHYFHRARPSPPPLFVNCLADNKHWLVPIPLQAKRRNRQPRKRCFLCYRQNRKTTITYICEECNVPLCVLCMKPYHTLPNNT